MPKKKHRTQQACIHLYNLPVPPAGHPTPRPPDPRPKNAKRTQSRPTAPYFHETNPISSAPSPPHDEKIRNEPNLIPAPPPHNPNMQNEPNFRRDHRPTTQKRETNPISATPDLWRTKKSKRTQSHPPLVPHASCLVPQKTRNEPNSCPAPQKRRRLRDMQIQKHRTSPPSSTAPKIPAARRFYSRSVTAKTISKRSNASTCPASSRGPNTSASYAVTA